VKGQRFAIPVGDAQTTGILYGVEPGRAAIVLAHGAGGRQDHPWMLAIARALTARGFDVVTFDFLYTHAGRKLPDKNAVLEATWRAVIDRARALPHLSRGPLFLGGKSMGGRIATQVAAGGDVGGLSGLVLLGYPLHPPGKPDKLRADHLPRVAAPMLFVQGARDIFGTPDELRPILAGLPRATLFVVEGGDHSLATSKRAGASAGDVLERVAAAIEAFAFPA
jgi:predicted alpha/beta-hydrolase family hydrolase